MMNQAIVLAGIAVPPLNSAADVFRAGRKPWKTRSGRNIMREYTRQFQDIDEIKNANRAAGRYFFEPETLRFFAGRVREQPIIGGRYFVHSTKASFSDYSRRYHVAVIADAGDVDNIGPDGGFSAPAKARRWARALAELPFVPMSEWRLPVKAETEELAWEAWRVAKSGVVRA